MKQEYANQFSVALSGCKIPRFSHFRNIISCETFFKSAMHVYLPVRALIYFTLIILLPVISFSVHILFISFFNFTYYVLTLQNFVVINNVCSETCQVVVTPEYDVIMHQVFIQFITGTNRAMKSSKQQNVEATLNCGQHPGKLGKYTFKLFKTVYGYDLQLNCNLGQGS